MISSNNMATTVSHAENCLYDVAARIAQEGSSEQRDALREAFAALEKLYFSLREEE